MKLVQKVDPTICLWIAGGSNSHNPDYVSNIQAHYGDMANVKFVGYVEEKKVPEVFAQSSVVILTNQSVGGESGALVQAGMYGKPVICTDLPLFRRKCQEGYALELFDVNDPQSIANAVLSMFKNDKSLLQKLGEQNRVAATSVSMDRVAQMYVDLIESRFG
jgi:glycosyltransferase involved in cell wall biosynthesis